MHRCYCTAPFVQLIVLITFSPFLAFAQNQSLEAVLQQAATYLRAGQEEQAATLLSKSITTVEADNDTLALLYHQLGLSHYYLLEDDVAIEKWEQALSLWEHFYPATVNDSVQTIIVKEYRNIGMAYQNTKQYEQEKAILEEGLKIYTDSGIQANRMLFDMYDLLGYACLRLNDLDNAQLYLFAALELSQQIAKDQPEALWRVMRAENSLLLLNKEKALPTKMIEHGFRALAVADEMTDKYEEDYFLVADVYNNLGLAYEQRNNYSEALKYYQKSIAINLSYPEKRQADLAVNYNNVAYSYQALGQYDEAMANIETAITIRKQLNDARTLAGNYDSKGNILRDQGQLQAALESYQIGINYLFPQLELQAVGDLPRIEDCSHTEKIQLTINLYNKAKVLQRLAVEESEADYARMALETFELLSQLIDQIRIGFASDESKAFLASQAKAIYERAIATCFFLQAATQEQHYSEQAFDFAEKSKSLILLEAVRENEIKKNIGIPAEQLEREEKLKRQIALLEQDLYEAITEEEKIRLSNTLIQTRNELSQFLEALEDAEPEYYQLKYKIEIPSISTIQAQLQEEAILEYFVGQEHIYWFLISKTQFLSGELPAAVELKSWIQDFRYSIFNKNNDALNQDSLAIAYARLGHRLHQALFAPLPLSSLSGKRLCIIPDGVLGYVPFDALLTAAIPDDQLGRYPDYPYLHHTFQLSYSYSVALLQEMNQIQHHPNQRAILAFAPIFQSRQPLQLGSLSIQLPPLLQNVSSTEKILQIMEGKPYLATEATKAIFLQEASNFAYLHLASHAQMNDENADYSFISFAQLEEQVSKDQLLFVSELYNRKLNAEMVVLSACETGLGELKEGEGIISLARAFSYAGAKSIITSLWQVNDQYTGELMVDFYKNLGEHFPKDAALHKAKQTMIEGGFQAHPYYWASFIPIGNMEAIEPGNSFPYWLVGLFALALGGLLVYRKIPAR